MRNNHNISFSTFYPPYIKELRKKYEIPQKELANIIGISNSSLSKIESGNRSLSPENFRKVLKYIERIDPHFYFNSEIAQFYKGKHIIYHALEQFVRLEEIQARKLLRDYLSYSENENGYDYFYRQLARIFLYALEQKDYIEIADHLLQTQYFQDDLDLAILYDFIGVRKLTSDPDELAYQIVSLKQSRRFAISANSKMMIGLVDFHLIAKYGRYDIKTAFSYLEECKENLGYVRAYRRLDWLKLNEATIYHRLRIYSYSIEILSDLYTSISGQEVELRQKIAENLSYSLLVQKEYLKAVQIAVMK